MAEINPPGFLQNAGATHTAEQMREWFQDLILGNTAANTLIGRGGVHSSRGFALQVTQTGSPSMAVIVKSGQAFIPGSEGSKQGTYAVLNDADVTLSITAAHATLNRIDIVCFKVQDSAYSGGVNSSSLVVVTGTPASSPAAPSAPANSITVAQVFIGAAVSSIVNANITDTRFYLAAVGGRILARSTARPAANTIPVGTEIYETDTAKVFITPDGGTTWVDDTSNYRARQILGGTTATVTFSSIPSTLRSLRLYVRANGNVAVATIKMTINGSGAANYSYQQIGQNNTASITPEVFSGQTSSGIGIIESTGFAISSVVFTRWDVSTELGWTHHNVSRGSAYTRIGGGFFTGAGPYTSLALSCDSGGSFTAGSVFELEGAFA